VYIPEGRCEQIYISDFVY